MSVQSVEAAASTLAAAYDTLRTEALAAVTAGVPISAVARAANVARPTIYRWIDEAS